MFFSLSFGTGKGSRLVSGLCFSFLKLQVQSTAGVTHLEPYDETT